MQLRRQVDSSLQTLGSRTGNARKVVRHLYEQPIVSAGDVSHAAEVSMPTAYKLIETLEGLNILAEITGDQRNRLYVFRDYLNLFSP